MKSLNLFFALKTKNKVVLSFKNNTVLLNLVFCFCMTMFQLFPISRVYMLIFPIQRAIPKMLKRNTAMWSRLKLVSRWYNSSLYAPVICNYCSPVAFTLNSCSVITRWISTFEWQLVALTYMRKLTVNHIFYWLIIHNSVLRRGHYNGYGPV